MLTKNISNHLACTFVKINIKTIGRKILQISNLDKKNCDSMERYYFNYNTGNILYSDWAGHYLIYKKFLSIADKIASIDLCCGSGAGTKLISKTLGTQVIGIDYSSQALEYAQNNNQDYSILYEKIDLNKKHDLQNLKRIIVENQIAQVFFIEGIEHLKDPFSVIDILVRNGVKRIFISTPFEKNNTIPSAYHIHPFTPSVYENFSKQFNSKILCYFKPTLVKSIQAIADKGYSDEEIIQNFITFSTDEAMNYLIEIDSKNLC